MLVLPTLAGIGATGTHILIIFEDDRFSAKRTAANAICVSANAGAGSFDTTDSQKAILAAVFLSVGLNIGVTTLIFLRLITTSAAMANAFPDRQRPAFYTRAASILIESAAPLTLFGVGFFITSGVYEWVKTDSITVTGGMQVAYDVFSWLYYSFCVSVLDRFNVIPWRLMEELGDLSANDHLPCHFRRSMERSVVR